MAALRWDKETVGVRGEPRSVRRLLEYLDIQTFVGYTSRQPMRTLLVNTRAGLQESRNNEAAGGDDIEEELMKTN